jgi:hypothetical protein
MCRLGGRIAAPPCLYQSNVAYKQPVVLDPRPSKDEVGTEIILPSMISEGIWLERDVRLPQFSTLFLDPKSIYCWEYDTAGADPRFTFLAEKCP